MRGINSKELKDFLQSFNVENFKYYGIAEDTIESSMHSLEVEQKIHKDILEEKLGETSEQNVYDTYSIAKMVYCDADKASDYAYIYDIILNKFLGDFVGIDGITDLYKSDYFVFEWMMHLEYNTQNRSYTYYRDHYIHQVRNLYEMYIFLHDLNFFQACVQQNRRGNSILTRYFRKMVEQERELEQLFSDDRERQEEYIYRYILYSAAFVTAVVHDIGYPIQYMSRNLQRMEEFLPISDYFFEKKNAGYAMAMHLRESLLYKITSVEEINQRVNKGDHGAISACILLMKFYMDGKIYSLSPAKRMVIELSAIAIYEHTLNYEILGNDDPERYQNVFQDNPFSFLFRVCDDLQEWDRTYFDITKQGNFLVCNKCGTIIRKNTGKNEKTYSCCCTEKIGINRNIFNYRKLAYVTVCTGVTIEPVSSIKGADKETYKIVIEYDLIRLLQATAYNQQFARKRAEALKESKIMLDSQCNMPSIILETYLSGNPIAIKTEIIDRYLNKKQEGWFKNCVQCLIDTVDAGIKKDKDTDVCKELKKIIQDVSFWTENQIAERTDEILNIEGMGSVMPGAMVIEVFRGNLDFYIKMAIVLRFLQQWKDRQQLLDEKTGISENLANYMCTQSKITYESTRTLVYHCILHGFFATKVAYPFTDDGDVTNYENMYQEHETLSNAVDSYINGDLYDNTKNYCNGSTLPEVSNKNVGYDFFSDYYLFEKIWETV